MARRNRDKNAREESKDRGCSCLNDCFESSAISIHSNIVSVLSKSFVDCFLKCSECCKDISYVSEFSRLASKRLMEAYKCNDHVKQLLEETKKYVDNLEEAAKQVFSNVFRYEIKLMSRLTVHCSSHHLPLEISLAWDPVLNVPYIPSSSIRGVVRAFFDENKVVVNSKNLAELFGDTEHSSDIVFFNVYPVRCEGENLVEADVITPHYNEVAGRIDEARSSPTPLVFPVLAPGTVLHVVVALEKPLEKELLSDFMNSVGKALESGLGAKTSVGYGRIRVINVLSKDVVR
ncbi:MAG: type III-B CRISPR module RAMP protein Cmr6 [Ignisphaera sp.]